MLIHDRSITEEDDLLTSKCRKSTDPLPWYQEYKESPVAIVEENEMPQWKTPEQLWDAVAYAPELL